MYHYQDKELESHCNQSTVSLPRAVDQLDNLSLVYISISADISQFPVQHWMQDMEISILKFFQTGDKPPSYLFTTTVSISQDILKMNTDFISVVDH